MEERKNGALVYTGTITEVGEVREYGTNGFAKREFIVCEDPQARYPRNILFSLIRGKKEDRTGLVKKENVGAVATVHAFVETRKWRSQSTGREGYSTEVSAFKVELKGAAKPIDLVQQGEDSTREVITPSDAPIEDLPF